MSKNKETQQVKYLSVEEIQRMLDDDIIKHIHIEHERTKIPVDDIWEGMQDSLGRQTLSNMVKGRGNSWNYDSERFMNLGIVYVFTFGLIWVVFEYLLGNKFEAQQFTIFACGLASICITILFMNHVGKNEKNYLNSVDKLRNAHSKYTERK